MSKAAAEFSARMPTLVPLNLFELEALASALAQASPPRRGSWRRQDNLTRKIGRVRDRKRKRAMRAARR